MSTYIKAYLGTTPLFTDGWTRPADWLPLPTATANSVKGLYAVFDQAENYVTVQMLTSNGGNYNIDWGDGTVQSIASNAIAIYNYSYSNPALNGTLTTRGYKQAIITISANVGQTFTYCNVANKPTSPAGFQNGLASGWLDLNVNLPNLTSSGNRLVIGGTIFSPRLLERVNISSWGAVTQVNDLFRNTTRLSSLNETEWNFSAITSINSMFYSSGIRNLNCANWNTSLVANFGNAFRDCVNLQSIECANWNLSSATDIGQLFMGCASLMDVDVSSWNVSNVQFFTYAFQSCRSLANINVSNWNTSKATTISNMFEACTALTEIITTNWTLPLCTNATGFISTCSNLREVGPLNFTSVTTITSATFANNCNSLTRCNIAGIKVSVNFTNCLMSATELDALYTSLATVAPAQTITVTGNYGTTADDPSIATAKGWIVTGS